MIIYYNLLQSILRKRITIAWGISFPGTGYMFQRRQRHTQKINIILLKVILKVVVAETCEKVENKQERTRTRNVDES